MKRRKAGVEVEFQELGEDMSADVGMSGALSVALVEEGGLAEERELTQERELAEESQGKRKGKRAMSYGERYEQAWAPFKGSSEVGRRETEVMARRASKMVK